MSFIILIAVFIVSCLLIYFASEWVVDGIMKVAQYLGWKEFVLSFLVMGFFGSLPNLFVGISSALQGIPELSLGDVISGSIINLTLVLAIPILLMGRSIAAEGKTINTTLLFTLVAIILPLALSLDGMLSRVDGVILVFFYFAYIFWLFAKKERFSKIYSKEDFPDDLGQAFVVFLKNLVRTVLGVALIIIAAQGIVWSAEGLATGLNLPLILVGIFVVGFGNVAPELYFSIRASERQNSSMILGNVMGCVIVPATLVLGTVAIIHPIEISGLAGFAIARLFLLFACIFFFLFSRSDKKITKKEAWFLVAFYALFLITEIIISLNG